MGKAGAPKGNRNAEKWSYEDAEMTINEAYKLSLKPKYDFIGEVARDMGLYRDLFVYLSDKFPELKSTYKMTLNNLEANCFSHIKENKINTAAGIINLKSNHGWTDRQQTDHTSKGEKINITPIEFIKNRDK